MESLILTVDEAAQALGITRNTAYNAVHGGELPAIRIGKRILVPKAALAKLLASAEQKPAAADVTSGG